MLGNGNCELHSRGRRCEFKYSVTGSMPTGVGWLVYEDSSPMGTPLAGLIGIVASVCEATISGEAGDKPSPQVFSPASPENLSTHFFFPSPSMAPKSRNFGKAKVSVFAF